MPAGAYSVDRGHFAHATAVARAPEPLALDPVEVVAHAAGSVADRRPSRSPRTPPPRPRASIRARWTRATPPPAPCPRTSRRSSAPPSSTRCARTVTTRPRLQPRWASPGTAVQAEEAWDRLRHLTQRSGAPLPARHFSSDLAYKVTFHVTCCGPASHRSCERPPTSGIALPAHKGWHGLCVYPHARA